MVLEPFKIEICCGEEVFTDKTGVWRWLPCGKKPKWIVRVPGTKTKTMYRCGLHARRYEKLRPVHEMP